MKFLIVLSPLFCLFCLSSAVPPSPNRYTTLSRFQAPPPSPIRPSPSFQGAPQRLQRPFPVRQTASAAPSPSYGPPAQVYGPPKDVYGPPTTDLVTTTEIEFTTEAEAESFKVQNQKQSTAENVERGQYYLLLPDGKLQRVQYVTSADLQKMAYSARLRYENVEPITGPIFTTANNQPFFPIFQKK